MSDHTRRRSVRPWSAAPERLPSAQGDGRAYVTLEVSTAGLGPRGAHGHWRETIFRYFEADRSFTPRWDAFNARAMGVVSPRGEFYCYLLDRISSCRRDDGDVLDTGPILHRWHCRRGRRGSGIRAYPGGFLYVGAASRVRIAWEVRQCLRLTLRRDMVEASLGRAVPPAGDMASAVENAALTPLLKAQMQLLVQHAARLAPDERTLVLDNAIDMALATLTSALDELEQASPLSGRQGLFEAAQRLIARELGNFSLNPRLIAQRLDCSRATLYRAFAEHRLTVAGYLRERRLLEARRLLKSSPPAVSVAEIAARCGFVDSASFSRLCRRRFGASPRELRKVALTTMAGFLQAPETNRQLP